MTSQINQNSVNDPALLNFAQKLVQIKSFSGQEENAARAIADQMRELNYDQVSIDSLGNVLGRIGNGPRTILFESHTDTVQVHDSDAWQFPPFSGEIKDGWLWGRGSVDMKSGLAASIFAAARARDNGWLSGKTIYVSGSVFEEDCDGEGIKHAMKEKEFVPDAVVICEPSGNQIVLGHKGKAQALIRTQGVSAHGSAPEKGKNAVYEMAEIIGRVNKMNQSLPVINGRKGTLVLSRISSTAVSLNAVPSKCEIYLDRRTVPGETQGMIEAELDALIAGKDASWEIDTVRRTAWTGALITYRPLHEAWELPRDHPLAQSANRAFQNVFASPPKEYDFWDFSTNAVALVSQRIPCIGFGPGEHKLAHMRDERCTIQQILDACAFYTNLINEF